MTASMGGEVQSNRLFGGAPESALAGAQAADAEGQDGGYLGEMVGAAPHAVVGCQGTPSG
jgi:hypothetical protein